MQHWVDTGLITARTDSRGYPLPRYRCSMKSLVISKFIEIWFLNWKVFGVVVCCSRGASSGFLGQACHSILARLGEILFEMQTTFTRHL